MSKTIDSFPYESPLEYPGKRNDTSYMLVEGSAVVDLPTDPVEALARADGLLADKGLPGIEERIPVLAYGRNASPSGAATKLEKYAHGQMATEAP